MPRRSAQSAHRTAETHCTRHNREVGRNLHVSGVQIDGDRAAGQRRSPFRGQQVQHPAGHRRQAGLYRLPLGRGDPPGQARRGRGRQPGHRGDQLARRITALAVQPGQEILPGQLRRRDPGQQLPGPVAAVPLLDGADRGIQRLRSRRAARTTR